MCDMFRTAFHNSVTTPLPSDIDPKSVVGILHDHSFLITLSPIVTGHEVKERDPETGWIAYAVHEVVKILPFGLWQQPTTFQCSFRDKQEGVTTAIEANLGIKSEADYTVRVSESEEEGSGWVLDEQIDSSCNFLLKWVVQSNMMPVRQKMHEQIIEKIRQRQKDGGKSDEAEHGSSGTSL